MSCYVAPGGVRIDLFAALGLEPLDFQLEARDAGSRGESGLIEVPTGSGKTLAVMAAPLERLVGEALATRRAPVGLRVLYVTPLRALSRDTERAIAGAISALERSSSPATDVAATPILSVECRTGDVSSSRRARQLHRMPTVLITTPESLSVLLSRPGSAALFSTLETVVVDEWHELLSTKRGTQVELALARLRTVAPGVRTWALTATIGNPEEAARAACGVDATARIVRSGIRRPIGIEVVLPADSAAMPWSGHLGTPMAAALLERLNPEVSTLIFTNTRKQAERWYLALLDLAPRHASRIALHHGSIDREIRERIEESTRAGRTTWVVATSSLDLGIDFAPVELVVQVGSPKSIARLVQRAGRSAHQPGRSSRVLFVPTHALELFEIHAARAALERTLVEARRPLRKPLDVLAQHLVTLACGDGFVPDMLFAELRSTAAYDALSREEFEWVLDFVAHGGRSLRAYDHYRKLEQRDGLWRVRTRQIARIHRMSIGTIDGNAMVRVSFTNGKPLGQIEEQFLARLRRGDTFSFAGRMVELVSVRDMTAFVRAASVRSTLTPTWPGGSLPFSASLGEELRTLLSDLATREVDPLTARLGAEQAAVSALPRSDELLAELLVARGAAHLFLFPFAGRRIHEGLGALLAARLGRREPASFSITTNDYGIQLESSVDYPFERLLADVSIFTPSGLDAELAEAANVDELARRAFRGIARVAGLVFPGYPGAQKSLRSLQASAGLLYDVFREHEPQSLLLAEARREVLESHFERDRLATELGRLARARLVVRRTPKPSPLAFPLLVEQLTQRRSSLPMEERIRRIRARYGVEA